MDLSTSQVSWTLSQNPARGHTPPRPRKDAADPGYFWRHDGKPKEREPHPRFMAMAQGILLQKGMRTDAALTLAVARSMEHRIAKVYAIEFAKYKFREFFPSSNEIEPGAMSYNYRMIERQGNAALIGNGNARDLPRVTAGIQENPSPVVTWGIGYGFNVIEEMSSSLANIALEDELAKAAREAMEKFADQVAAIGIPGTGIVGVTNAPGVAAVKQQSVAAGTWQAQIAGIATASSTNATPPAVVVAQAIAMDITTAASVITTQTLENQEATDCILPTNLYSMLKSVPRSPGFTQDNLLQYLETLTGLEFHSWNALQNAGNTAGSTLRLDGSGGTQKTRILVYDRDPEVVQWMEAMPFTQLAPQIAGLEYLVPCFERGGGIMMPRPLGAVYIDGC